MIDAKAFATQRARAALIQASLQHIEDDSGRSAYVLTKNHITRQLRSLAEVAVWIDRLEPTGHAMSRSVTRENHGTEGHQS